MVLTTAVVIIIIIIIIIIMHEQVFFYRNVPYISDWLSGRLPRKSQLEYLQR
jgi:hypothetical protein